jgi:uroporphyrinogen III methyltransferase / synthase
MIGKVFLVGAGPGDPSLITVKGLNCLKNADVVLYDYLAHPTLLSYCKSSCRLIDVGKKKGLHRQTQDQINDLLITYAKTHKKIVRLKGGDPLIFGRGGEELSVLVKQSIPFEIVPGVTSAIAAPAYAGIPLTHRLLSRSVAFVTGSLQKGEDEESIEIPLADTLVFLMPLTNLSVICSKLKQTSKFNEDTPCALIHYASTAKQKSIVAVLSSIEEKATSIQTPVLFIVGEVVSFSDTFQWVTQQPLHSKRIVLLRSIHQSRELMDSLSTLGAEVVHFPLLQFSKNRDSVNTINKHYISQFDSLAFSSQNGVKYFMEALVENKLDIRCIASKKIISIGEKTSDYLKEYCIFPDKEATPSTSEGLMSVLDDDDDIKKVLYPTSTVGMTTTQKTCTKELSLVPLYKTEKPEHLSLSIENGDWVVFTSPSSVIHFFEEVNRSTEGIIAFCIGRTTEKELSEKFDGTIIVAQRPSAEGLVDAILTYNKDLV